MNESILTLRLKRLRCGATVPYSSDCRSKDRTTDRRRIEARQRVVAEDAEEGHRKKRDNPKLDLDRVDVSRVSIPSHLFSKLPNQTKRDQGAHYEDQECGLVAVIVRKQALPAKPSLYGDRAKIRIKTRTRLALSLRG